LAEVFLWVGQWTQNSTALMFLAMKMCEMPQRRLLLKIQNHSNLQKGILKKPALQRTMYEPGK